MKSKLLTFGILSAILLVLLPLVLAAPPVMMNVSLNASHPGNFSNQNLTCYANATDADGGNVNYSGFWYKNNIEQFNVWNKTIGGSGNDVGYGAAVDSDNNIIVTGYTRSFGAGGSDVWIIKYNSSGNQTWNTTIGGSSDDEGNSVAVDSNDNVIVVGYTTSFGAGGSDVWVIKLNSSGNVTWNTTIGGSSDDVGYGIAVDSNDNIIVMGNTTSFGAGGSDIWTIKYNSSGNQTWNTTIGGSNSDYGHGVAVDSNDNIIVTGVTNSFGAGNNDVWTIKYNSSGNQTWNTTIGGSSDDVGYGIAVDSNDNIIVMGNTTSFGAGGYDVWTIKYNSSGNQTWNRTIGGSGTDAGFGVAVDSNDNIIVTGVTDSFGAGLYDVWTIKYYGFNLNSQTQGQTVPAAALDSSETTTGDVWQCRVKAYDGQSYSGYLASNNISLFDPPIITPYFVSPTSDARVIQYTLINITMGFTCLNANCGNVNATLDPILIEDAKNAGADNVNQNSANQNIQSQYAQNKTEKSSFVPVLLLLLVLSTAVFFIVFRGPSAKTALHILFIVFFLGSMLAIVSTTTNIFGYAVYDSASNIVSTTPGATPFFTTSANPQVCSNVLQNQQCNVSWIVNGTGNYGTYIFFAIFNSSNGAINNQTSNLSITLIEQYCYSCGDCSSKLINNTYIYLNHSIGTASGNCILLNGSNATLDCRGNGVFAQLNNLYGAIKSDGKSNITIRSCIAENSARGIWVDGGIGNTIINNTVRNMSNHGIILDKANSSTVEDNIIANVSAVGIILQRAFDGNGQYDVVRNNRISYAVDAGILAARCAYCNFTNNTVITSSSGIAVTYNSNSNVFEGNYLINNSAAGIFFTNVGGISNSTYNIIKSNYFLNNTVGITVSNTSFNNITENVFRGNADTTVHISVTDNVSQANRFWLNNFIGTGADDLSNSTKWSLRNVSNFYSSDVSAAYIINDSVLPINQEIDFSSDYCGDCGHCDNLVDADDNKVVLSRNISSTSLCITINANNVVLDCKSNSIQSDGNDGININSEKNNNTVKNCVIKNSVKGITISDYGSGNRIINNTILNISNHGILLDKANSSIVEGNVIANISDAGIILHPQPDGDYSYNIIRNNRISHALYGILSIRGTYNNFTNNTVMSSGLGIAILYNSNSNILENNTVVNNTDGIIFSAFGIANSSQNIVKQNNIINNSYGISILNSSYNNFTENTISSGRSNAVHINITSSISAGNRFEYNSYTASRIIDLGLNTVFIPALPVEAAAAAEAPNVTRIIGDHLTEQEIEEDLEEIEKKLKLNETVQQNKTNETICILNSAKEGSSYALSYDCDTGANCFRIYYKKTDDKNWKLWKEASGTSNSFKFGIEEPKINVAENYMFGLQARRTCAGLPGKPVVQIGEIESIPKEITAEELKKIDTSRIGIAAEDIGTEKAEIVEISSSQTSQVFTKRQVKTAMETIIAQARETASQETITKLEQIIDQSEQPDAVMPTITKSLKTYEIRNTETGEVQPVSKIVITVTAAEGMENLNIVEVISKSVAEDVAEITFSEQPEILQADPIVKWYFDDLPPGQSKDFSYTVNKKLDTIDSETVASAEQREKAAIEEMPVGVRSGIFYRFGFAGIVSIAVVIIFVVILLIPVFFRRGETGIIRKTRKVKDKNKQKQMKINKKQAKTK